MRSMGLFAATLVCVVFYGLVVGGEAAKPAETKPATKVDKALTGAAEHPHGFYLDAGINALIFNPPERKSLPIYDTNNQTRDALMNQTRFESDALAAYPRLAFGYEFAKDATPSILGEDLRVEFSSAFFWTDPSETEGMVLPTRHPPPGSFAIGMLYGPGGDGSGAILNRSGATGISGMPLRYKADYAQLDLNLGMRTEYTLVKDRLLISPYVGFTRQTLDQNLTLSTQRLQDITVIPPDNPRYKASEEFDTEAYGATFGLDFKVRILKRLSFTAGGTVSPLWASTDMRLSYFGDVFDTTGGARVGVASGLKDSEDEFTFRATAKAAFSYEVNKWLVITASGGMDYWDYVPQVKYPTYLPNEHLLGFGPKVVRKPTIGHDNMLNWMGGLNFTVRFGCP